MPPAAGKGGEIPRDESDDSSWVRVEPRSRRGTRRPHAPAIKPAPARTVHVRPVSEIDAEYQRIRAQWLESTAHTRLCQIVDAIASSNITRAVCLGIGSFDPPDGAWEAKKTAFVQFIAFKTIVDQLEKRSKSSIPCFFQEPLFTESDKQFIQSLGHDVVDSPAGGDMVQSNTFLFGIHLYRPLYAQALKNSLPAVFVGTGWPVWDRLYTSQLDDLHNLEEMDRVFEKSSFPADCFGNAFSDTTIYWQPSTPSGPGGTPLVEQSTR